MANEFKKLLNRSDLPAMILQYDTTFDLGNFFMSWLTFRFTEFEYLSPKQPMPIIALACMIHSRKLERVHDYFWSRLLDVIPELKTATNVVICTDEECSIVNSLRNALPGIQRSRCFIHTWKNIKIKLRELGITKKEETAAYRRDFHELLNMKSFPEYQIALRYISRNWNEV